MKVLITGITGFVGSHMADYLLAEQKHVKIFGTKRWRSPLDNVLHLMDKVDFIECDLEDQSNVDDVISKIKPDKIFHLAAQSFVPASFVYPAVTLRNNIIGTLTLLEAVRKAKIDPVIHICSSSEVYGQVKEEEVPIKETNPLRPYSPYAVSKVGEDLLSFQYFVSYGLKTVRTRSFTHTGPRRGDVFAMSSFSKQLAMIEEGLQEPVIRVGNLKSIRTFLDVRDLVDAYWLITEKGVPGEVYNIGGNETMTIGEGLDVLLSLTSKKVEVRVDPSLLRPSDVTLQIPDITKFVKQTGWKAKIPFKQTMKDLLEYWRERIALERGMRALRT